MTAKPPVHIHDVPESDRAIVPASAVQVGDCLFDVFNDQWVTIERVRDGSSRSWRIDRDDAGRWTFTIFFEGEPQPGPGWAAGNVIRRKAN
ncbi:MULTISPECIES: hypothetical protein [Mycobacterium]|uniref:hypothetical protein n=1 Tax=Mycobacterium TaxID=1763 RepID=UPI001CD98536|nr:MULTISPECIES: hypothetical protein [Mycobacterium]MCA2241158.1 hypothetical protein [Mycobacterium sp. WUMAC-067]MCA2313375.1 hypothetical protein [Mycobacterium sp. WUMAC-025]MEE3753358.1 hypothetical protein [Mycobacterium intracellulare]